MCSMKAASRDLGIRDTTHPPQPALRDAKPDDYQRRAFGRELQVSLTLTTDSLRSRPLDKPEQAR